MTNDYPALLTRAALEIDGVTSVSVAIDSSNPTRETYRVIYRGTAREADLYAALNYRTDLRPAKTVLMVVRNKS